MINLPSDMPDNVRHVIGSYPLMAQKKAKAIRSLIFSVAATEARIGPLTETLKWNEPAYLTEISKSGTTIRYDWKVKSPDDIGIFFQCQTSLVSTFDDLFGDELRLDGNRTIWLSINEPLPSDILKHCLHLALTYKLQDKS